MKLKFIIISLLSFAIISLKCKKETSAKKDNLQHPDSSYLPIIFLCGQSNMEGVSLTDTILSRFTKAIPNAYIFYKPSNSSATDGSVQILHYGINNNWRNPYNYFGPEEGIAYYLTQAGHRIAIVKYAYGGSKLSLTTTPSPNGYWQINAADSLNHYRILINDWATQSLEAFKRAGYKPYIAAFVWCQGETDSHDLAAANNYKMNFTQMLNKFKTDMQEKDPFVSNMRLIITRTKNNYPYSNMVRKAQVDIANSYHNGYWIDSDGWPVLQDGIHFTPETQATMQGKSIADILSKVIP